MRYGQTSHNKEKDFIDDEVEDSADAGRIVMTDEAIPHFPRRNANSSNMKGIPFSVRVPNSMENIEFSTAPSVRYIPGSMYDSTPRNAKVPSTHMRINDNLPKFMMQKKKRK